MARRRTCDRKQPAAGFTLVETVIAVMLFSVMAISAYGTFRSGFLAYQRVELTLGSDHELNMLMRELNEELKNAVSFADAPFEGESDSIRFPSRLLRYTEGRLSEDLYQVSYQFRGRKLERTEERLRRSFANHEVVKESLLSLESCRFQFAYKKQNGGVEWKNEWGKDPYLGLPRSIRLVIRHVNSKQREPEKTFHILIPHGILGMVK